MTLNIKNLEEFNFELQNQDKPGRADKRANNKI